MLNEEERQLAIARIYADQPEVSQDRNRKQHTFSSFFVQIKDTKEAVNKKLLKRGVLNVTTLACSW